MKTKVRKGQRGSGAPDTRAELLLQPMKETTQKQTCTLQPMKVPTLEEVDMP